MTDLRCYYCRVFDDKDMPAPATIHDQRGCVRVCFKHAKWRATTSMIFGHSPDCPHATEKTKP